MKAVITIIDWKKDNVPLIHFFHGEEADAEARNCWERLKHEWPGCGFRIEMDEELRQKKTRREPGHIRLTADVITLTWFLPNNSQARAAIQADDRAQILALADPRAPARGAYLSLQYAAKPTKQVLDAFENNDWFWIVERAQPVFGET